jgi:hypothetical protein
MLRTPPHPLAIRQPPLQAPSPPHLPTPFPPLEPPLTHTRTSTHTCAPTQRNIARERPRMAAGLSRAAPGGGAPGSVLDAVEAHLAGDDTWVRGVQGSRNSGV